MMRVGGFFFFFFGLDQMYHTLCSRHPSQPAWFVIRDMKTTLQYLAKAVLVANWNTILVDRSIFCESSHELAGDFCTKIVIFMCLVSMIQANPVHKNPQKCPSNDWACAIGLLDTWRDYWWHMNKLKKKGKDGQNWCRRAWETKNFFSWPNMNCLLSVFGVSCL